MGKLHQPLGTDRYGVWVELELELELAAGKRKSPNKPFNGATFP
jgi:hypothetical protein